MRSVPVAFATTSLLCTALLVAAAAAPARAAKILILGDSHTVGPFGATLDWQLRKQGHETSLQAVCGASATWWLRPPRARLSICWALHDYGEKPSVGAGKPPADPPYAKDLLAADPDVVVFALGSNPDGNAAATGARAEELLALLPSSARCFWVGPPPMPKRLAPIGAVYNELPQAFSRAARSCTLIDSRALIKPEDAAANDHFYGAPAVAWGKAAAAKILAALPAAP